MSERRKIDEYLAAVGEQIRWKRARKPLLSELEAHILDRRDALVEQGEPAERAETQAVAEMGDPVEAGLALDRVHRPQPNWLLIGSAAVLLILGIALYAALGGMSYHSGRIFLYAGIGIVFLLGGYFCDYTLLARRPGAVFITLSAAIFVFALIGNTFWSTASQLCYALPLAFAALAYKAHGGGAKKLFALCLAFGGCIFLGFMSVPGFTMAMYNAVVCAAVLIYAAAKKWFGSHSRYLMIAVIALVLVSAGLVAGTIISSPSALWRIEGIFAPYKEPFGAGWVTLRLRELLTNSVFVGEGATSESLQAFVGGEFSSVEYMLAAATHKFGYIVLAAVLLLLAVMTVTIIVKGSAQSSFLGRITSLTIG
ncbi:MAG: hypothetical protein IJC18_03215, partial [Clostridia bacterium]|nr:hypothetical protein [Clostridia bacterium]